MTEQGLDRWEDLDADVVAANIYRVVGRDSKKLVAAHKPAKSVWGRISTVMFGANEVADRRWLYTAYNNNENNLQVSTL
jgi:hypothetical protein